MATTTKLISTLLILSLFSLSPACNACCSCGSTPTPSPATSCGSTPTPTPTPPTPSPTPSCGSIPTPSPAAPTPSPAAPTPSPGAPATPPPATSGKCPLNTLKLGACADVLGLVHAVIGNPPSGPKCCSLIKGLADLEAAACLCTAIKAKVLGINLEVPVTLSLILSACQKEVPPGFKC